MNEKFINNEHLSLFMLPRIFTRKNIEILQLISEKELCIREIAQELKISPGKVHNSIKLFKKNKMIIEQKIKNRLVIRPNRTNQLYKKIKLLMNLCLLIENPSFKKLQKIGKVGIYGSFAKGEDEKESDIDIWLYTEKKMLATQESIRKLEKDMKKKLNLLILNKKKIENLKKHDYEFYIRLKLTSLQFNGDVFA